MTVALRDLLVKSTLGMVAAALACTTADDRPRAKSPPPARGAAVPKPASAEERWVPSADSALSVYLSDQRFRDSARVTRGFGDCDTGGDNATMLVAIARHRVIGHTEAVIDSTPDDAGGPARTVGFTLELYSVAHLVPTWTLDENERRGFVTPSDKEPYVARVGVRVDTATISIAQSMALPARWSVCGLTHEGDPHTRFWDFINGRADFLTVVKWEPAGSSWDAMGRLADSVAKSH